MSQSPFPSPAGAEAVTVVGAGIVGLACARALQRDGRAVTVIDPGEPGGGASYGNAGILSAGSVLPEATPGLLRRVPGMLLDPLAPLTIRPAYLPRLMPFLLRMLRNATPARVEALSAALATLVLNGMESWRALLDDEDFAGLVRRQGCLYLYETAAALKASAADNAMRRRRGVAVELLGPDEVKQLVPALGPRIAGGALATGSGHVVNPLRLAQALAARIRADGGRILRERVTGFETDGSGSVRAITERGSHAAGAVVVAAGAFSRPLAAALGSRVPLDTERGYHMMLPKPGVELRLPLLVSPGGFGVTPMEHGIRLAGTVEFAGLEAPPNHARADLLLRHARRLFPELADEGAERWMGFRPSLPDSLPVISASPHRPNVFFAFGHGHLGLSLAAVTGRMVADLAAGRRPVVDPQPFRVDRF
ncbi:MAG TPA: FAD-dependent oxidoreductase [Alphaproteobacteria bacterium]|nr:FAD-dependent oxidoreductase [Alphaproteobacteria bacterium]